MNNKVKFLLYLICLSILFTACSLTPEEDASNSLKESQSPVKINEKVKYKGDSNIVAESENTRLYLDEDTATIRLESKQTGIAVETKVFDKEGGSDLQKSDLNISYYIGSAADKYRAYDYMDTYSMSIMVDKVSYEKIDQGVRVIYEVGDDSVSYADFPAKITKKRMEDLILQYTDRLKKKIVETHYRLTKSGLYVRSVEADSKLSPLAGNELYHIFYEVGHYTTKELETDNVEHGEVAVTGKQQMTVFIEYYLDGDDLMVKVPTNEIVYMEDFPLKSINLLPYFMSTKSKEGYLFVPDGSGGLIYLDNTKFGEFQFTSRYYGGDCLVNATTYNSSQTALNMPVYGIKADDYALFGIIEKGAEVATLSANTSGYFGNDPYGKVNLSFEIREQQKIAASNLALYEINKVAEDYYNEDIIVRYRLLIGDNANYSGMAKTYREYLVEHEAIKQNNPEENASFYVETLGTLDKTKHFLGIPYNGKISLTNFQQAEEILTKLTKSGISNVKMEYKGLANNGLNQENVNKVSIQKNLGGKKELKKLNDYANSIGADVFPSFKLQTVDSQKGISKNQRAFFLNGQTAELFNFDLILKTVNSASKRRTYLLRSSFLPDYITRFSKSYQKLGIENVASSDFYSFLIGSYKNGDNLSMTHAIPYYKKSADILDQTYNIMISNPIADAYKYVDYVTNLPMDNSKFKILDAEVPFMQMVLTGLLDYSTESLNTQTLNIDKKIMKAIETKSSLKFRFMYDDSTILANTDYNDIFMVEFSKWEDKLGDYYKIYNDFYQKVKDSYIIDHTIVEYNNEWRIVTYSNGVKVLLNYSDKDKMLNGILVGASSFVVD